MATTLKSRSAARPGRPSRDRMGEVEERILDAAQRVFLDRGLEGASVDEIAEAAHAGKPSIYARFPHKEAIFIAVMERMVRRRTEAVTAARLSIAADLAIEERLAGFAALLLRSALVEDTVALVRAAIAEARRFPDLASSVHRMLRERGDDEVGRLLAELVAAGQLPRTPALAPERLTATAGRFIGLAMLPLMMRGLFGEPLASLRNEIDAHVRQAVEFFLAGCGHSPAAPSSSLAPSPGGTPTSS